MRCWCGFIGSNDSTDLASGDRRANMALSFSLAPVAVPLVTPISVLVAVPDEAAVMSRNVGGHGAPLLSRTQVVTSALLQPFGDPRSRIEILWPNSQPNLLPPESSSRCLTPFCLPFGSLGVRMVNGGFLDCVCHLAL